ncbi:energy transducer TonB [Acetobacteraceae bacterium KSS8]|uniref:Energy transducer TonB n=1 Tax=Endosaccharibacter trunci TaxID=2812733 RepID=A0ABT1WA74_9PROT|nr:energy transducer TonB [Acetobacteraceae bacterium KSS8]
MLLVRRRISAVATVGLLMSACTPAVEKEQPLPPASGAGLVFPLSAEEEGRSGWADLSCVVAVDGTTRNCVVEKASASDFAAASLNYLQHAHYIPARRAGVAVEAPHHTVHFTFTMPTDWTILVVTCDVQATGTVRNCWPRHPLAADTWQALRPVLEGVVAVPRTVDGHAVDDPDRPVRLLLAIDTTSGNPTTLTGDFSGSLILRCSKAPAPLRLATAHCTAGNDSAAAPGAGQYKANFAIRGLAPQATGDFSE